MSLPLSSAAVIKGNAEKLWLRYPQPYRKRGQGVEIQENSSGCTGTRTLRPSLRAKKRKAAEKSAKRVFGEQDKGKLTINSASKKATSN